MKPSPDHDGEGVRPSKRPRLAKAEVPSSKKPVPTEKGDPMRVAIEQHRVGQDLEYNRIKEIFTTQVTDNDPSPNILGHVQALIRNVSLLDRSCSGLVHAVIGCEWLGRDKAFVALFVRFLGTLVSAQGIYVGAVLGMLVESFSVSASSGRLPGHAPLSRSQMYARSHMALRHILDLVPSGSSTLLAHLAANFPHSTESKRAHRDYINNMITLAQYVPELKAEVMALTTERLVKIDVQVQVDMEDLEEDAEEGLVREISPPADDDADSDTESIDESDMPEEMLRMRQLKANVAKMDTILDILFAYYSPTFASSSAGAHSSFDMLLNHFATIILPTYRSRHTQFLLFHFAQTSDLLIDKFAGTCFHLMCDQTRPTMMRQSSAAYLASFIARGAHVPKQVVRDVFQLLMVHLDKIRIDQEAAACRGSDIRRHATFHAMVQALLYIFCFRWRDLTDTEDGLESEIRWTPGIKEGLTRAIYSKLNPLRVCSPPIVQEFARIANQLRFMYIYPLLESNRRLHLFQLAMSSTYVKGGDSVRRDDHHHHLDAYFPFDPYHLPISKRWLKGDYVEWQDLPGSEAKENHTHDDSEDE
ncbi:MAG: hypothetical protein M1823_001129 [Watsoniomyces obsoletus]|nr:MAG: hypothetical protein M1823_001129 [Watsoniomyces obsoletus]